MEKKCQILINNLSGSCNPQYIERLVMPLAKGCVCSVFHVDEKNHFCKSDTNRLIVCGGDGTLNRAVNLYDGDDIELVYCPFGTLNEASKGSGKKHKAGILTHCGQLDDGRKFCYVLGCGTFTPLGYSVRNASKRKLKALAYIGGVFKELKVHRTRATITTKDFTLDGEFCLIMALHSAQCFGLRFNRMFQPNKHSLHLLAIKAPRHNGFLGLAEMFFSFFRAFFIGFGKPYHSKKMTFAPITQAKITTQTPTDFCVDGEKWQLPCSFEVKAATLNPRIIVYPKRSLKQAAKKIKQGKKL